MKFFIYGGGLLPPNMVRTRGWSTKVSRRDHGCGLWCSIRAGWNRFS